MLVSINYVICFSGVKTYQFPRRVIFADGYTDLRAAGTLPENAGRTEMREANKLSRRTSFNSHSWQEH